jgi:acetoacetyl-CoA synthetase
LSGEGDLLWEPSAERIAGTAMARFSERVAADRGLDLGDYADLWRWSVTDVEGYWRAVWDFFGVRSEEPYEGVLAEDRMPGAIWFPGARLNFAEQMLRAGESRTAIRFRNEVGEAEEVSRDELRRRVGALAATLREVGIEPGDRVVGFLPNLPETVVAFLAAASLGAVWSCCSPDFGADSVVDRFAQIEPKVLIAVDGYRYNGKVHERRGVVEELRERLPGLEQTIVVRYLEPDGEVPEGAIDWADAVAGEAELEFLPVPFEHPLWILYSSGTTGPPKAIVQGHGGVLLGLLAGLGLQYDVGADDIYFWFTSTGWAVWNVTVTGLLLGATVVLYDGSPTYPSPDRLWELAAETGITWFGAGAPLMVNWMREGLRPGRDHDLSKLRTVAVTGAPMPAEGFRWVYDAVAPDVWFFSISGGTDSLVPLVGGAPTLPVRAGEIQCRALGVAVEAWDEDGRPLTGEVGELVITRPLPSMPLRFWDDPGDERLRETYFATYPGVWRHGDWIRIEADGSVEILGRSDATLNRMGVRIGSSEIYGVVEGFGEIADSLVVDLSNPRRQAHMVLFVVPAAGAAVDEELLDRLRAAIRAQRSPRHVPDEIRVVADLPRTLNGKKMEVPVKRILLGADPDRAVNRGATQNPEALATFTALAAELAAGRSRSR